LRAFNILLTGVGGQGILLGGDILSRAALMEGLDVKKAETHGMAQRGGSVVTHIRLGKKVLSAMVPVGSADLLVSFELLEALRYAHYVKDRGAVVYSTRRFDPLPVLRGEDEYPSPRSIQSALRRIRHVADVDAESLAIEAGHPLTQNVVMIGAASTRLPISVESLREAVEVSVKRAKEANLKAFDLGRRAVEGRLPARKGAPGTRD
jgi:indolepyruvate ferredoxin oxidoreductase beta subunit